MALATLAPAGAQAGHPVVWATLRLPRSGAWKADLEVGVAEALSGKVDLHLGDTVFQGTVASGAVTQGVFRARMVAGANGLRTKVTPRHYSSPTFGVVLRDIAKDAGETISATASAAILGIQFEHWTTISMPAAQAIYCLMEHAAADATWRLLADGSIWLGTDAFADAGLIDVAELDESPQDGVVDLGMATSVIFPGTKIGARLVDSVELSVSGQGMRAKIWTA
jgi:hypothetical protein